MRASLLALAKSIYYLESRDLFSLALKQRRAWVTCAFSRLKVVVPEVFRQNDSPTENCGQEEVAMLGV